LAKNEAETLRKRRELFREITGTKKYLVNTLISTFGLKEKTNSTGVVEKELKIDQFF
jgi:hypothetical protein